VDNEKIFKGALGKNNYKLYFRDMFAGDFGHCTLKGNLLLAENIARAIFTQVLKIEQENVKLSAMNFRN